MTTAIDPTRRLLDRLAQMLWHGPIGLAQLDRELRFVALNETLAEMNGLPVEQHLGRTPMELVPGVPASTIDAIRSVLATGESVLGHEFVAETPAQAGVPRAWLETYHPIRDARGAVTGVGVVVVEVTQRHTEEARTRQLQTVTEALSVATTERDVAQAILDQALRTLGAERGALWLRRGAQLEVFDALGYAPGGDGLLDAIAMDADRPVAEVARTGQPLFASSADQLRAIHPVLVAAMERFGTRSVALIPIGRRDAADGVLALAFTDERFLDDEERAWAVSLGQLCGQAFERARSFESQANLRLTFEQALDQMPIGVVVMDQDERVVVGNSATAQLFGRPVPRGLALEDFAAWPRFHPDGTPFEVNEVPIVRTAQLGQAVEGEEVVVARPDGSRRLASVSSVPVRDASGAVIGSVSILLDVTAQRETEGVREAFLGVLSHELRTPITTVYGGISVLLRGGQLDETQRSIAEDVASEAERLHRLVEDLLVVARVERGALGGDVEPLLLPRLLPRIVEDEQRRWPGAQFVTRIPPLTPVVAGDQSYVEQIVRNLLSNAAKYGGAEPVEVEVEVAPDESSVTIHVLDRGPGIPPLEVSNIFDLFYRSTATKSQAGAGIGLFVARSLAEALRGEIWAAPRDGGGTDFALRLPAHALGSE